MPHDIDRILLVAWFHFQFIAMKRLCSIYFVFFFFFFRTNYLQKQIEKRKKNFKFSSLVQLQFQIYSSAFHEDEFQSHVTHACMYDVALK